jgi:hypothetical protein
VFEISGSKAIWTGDRAVVGIVKEENIVTVTLMMLPNTADEFWFVPFVHDHKLNAIQKTIKSQPVQGVRSATQVRVCLAEGTQRCCPMLSHEVD